MISSKKCLWSFWCAFCKCVETWACCDLAKGTLPTFFWGWGVRKENPAPIKEKLRPNHCWPPQKAPTTSFSLPCAFLGKDLGLLAWTLQEMETCLVDLSQIFFFSIFISCSTSNICWHAQDEFPCCVLSSSSFLNGRRRNQKECTKSCGWCSLLAALVMLLQSLTRYSRHVELKRTLYSTSCSKNLQVKLNDIDRKILMGPLHKNMLLVFLWQFCSPCLSMSGGGLRESEINIS